ncbi:MAG: hypothetical protein QM811_08865 [Pirellulales bacterium]
MPTLTELTSGIAAFHSITPEIHVHDCPRLELFEGQFSQSCRVTDNPRLTSLNVQTERLDVRDCPALKFLHFDGRSHARSELHVTRCGKPRGVTLSNVRVTTDDPAWTEWVTLDDYGSVLAGFKDLSGILSLSELRDLTLNLADGTFFNPPDDRTIRQLDKFPKLARLELVMPCLTAAPKTDAWLPDLRDRANLKVLRLDACRDYSTHLCETNAAGESVSLLPPNLELLVLSLPPQDPAEIAALRRASEAVGGGPLRTRPARSVEVARAWERNCSNGSAWTTCPRPTNCAYPAAWWVAPATATSP